MGKKGEFVNVKNLLARLKKENNQRVRYRLTFSGTAKTDSTILDISEKSILGPSETIKVEYPVKLGLFMKGLKKQLKSNPEKWFILKTGTKFYTVHDKNIDKLLNQILKGNLIIQNMSKSDGEFLIELFDFDVIEVSVIFHDVNPLNGGFFPFTHCTPFSLEKYGIFRNESTENYQNNCLYEAFYNSELFDLKEELDELALSMNSTNFPICKLQDIANKLQVNITLKREIKHKMGSTRSPNPLAKNQVGKKAKRSYKDTRTTHYISDKCNKTIKIGLINCGNQMGHYFINDRVSCIKEYQLKKYINGEEVLDFSKNSKGHKNMDIEAFKMIRMLMGTKFLIPIESSDRIQKTQHGNKFKKITNLNYRNHNTQLYTKSKEIKNKPFSERIFFDFEAYTDGRIHEAYGVNTSTGKDYKGERCGINFLKSLKHNSISVVHNLSYDLQFLIKYMMIINMIKNNGLIMQVTAIFKKKKLIFKDSYSLISKKLSDFPEMFKLECVKEVMPYNIYTKSKNMERYSLEKALVCVKSKYETRNDNGDLLPMTKKEKKDQDDDVKCFLDNIEKWNCRVGKKHYNAIKYSIEYCRIDVEILQKGYMIFREWIMVLTTLDIDHIVSIASIADMYQKIKGSYDDCYKLSGVPRQFIQQCVVGGRVMMKNNLHSHIIGMISDFDACSLYPSAIKRLGGYLIGKPKILSDKQCDELTKNTSSTLQKYDGVFVEIKVLSIGKKRAFPLLSYIDEKKGSRIFTNDMAGRIQFVDKICLEDFIKFQKAKVQIIQGYYFDEGRNDTSVGLIQELYEERKIKKLEKNPAQTIYKLMMNSTYGRTIMKPINDELKFVYGSTERRNRFIIKHHNFIKEQIDVSGEVFDIDNSIIDNKSPYTKSLFKMIKPLNTHFSAPHIGTEILSMSKRIMNEVMCLAEDNDIDIFYQDTDSMHMNYNDIVTLSVEFKKLYDRDLVGTEMGQFHNDFDFKSDEPVYSAEAWIIGKKCYIDKIRIIKDKVVSYEYHIRMKGVPDWSIIRKARLDGITVMELYEKLYNGKKINFIMTNKQHIRMKKESNFTYTTIKNDKGRNLSF